VNKFNAFLENKVLPIAGKIAGQRHLLALRDGIVLSMPLIIIGSIFLILGNLPIPGYSEFMTSVFGSNWVKKLNYPVDATFNIMGLVAAFGVSYRLAKHYKIDAVSAGVISVAAFLMATPFQIPFTPSNSHTEVLVTGGIPVDLMGSKGLFVALVIALLSTEIYRWILQKNLVIRMPDGVPPAVSKSFVALIPGFVIITLIWIIRLIVEITSVGSLHNLVSVILGKPLSTLGGSLGGSLVAEFMLLLLWSCGLHGNNIVGAGVMAPIWYGAMDENRIAFQNHEALPNIFTYQFFDIFINIGGSGATFALVLAMIFRAKSQQSKQLGKLAIGPAFFNINEPIIFGLPIVLNPLMIVPFIITPLITVTATYFGMRLGWVAKPAGIAVPWTMPPLISGYLATGGKISGAVMQLINIGIAFIVYYPFFKILDKQNLNVENETAVQETKINTVKDKSIKSI
jgi:PTS system cellobiose-specific IIC component